MCHPAMDVNLLNLSKVTIIMRRPLGGGFGFNLPNVLDIETCELKYRLGQTNAFNPLYSADASLWTQVLQYTLRK